MSPPIKQCTFAGGEITPAAFARSDLALYEKSARTIRNMICMKHGGVSGRPGTMYVGTTLNSGNPVRLIPFIFNETGLGQSYMLEFGNQYVAFYQNGAVVISAPNTPYTIASPYLQADLQDLNFGQNADILTITHHNYQVRELRRNAPTNWNLVGISNWGSQIPWPINVIMNGSPANPELPANYYFVPGYFISAVDVNGQESDALSSNFVFYSPNPYVAPSIGAPTAISWDAVNGAVSYKIYSNFNTNVFGFIGQVTGTHFNDPAIIPDLTNLYPQANQYFGSDGTTNNPAIVGFSQQRRYFANTIDNPVGFWGSRPGSYSNLDSHLISQDDDAVIGSLAGEEVNAIQAITELKFMLMLTTGAEIYVQGDGSGVVKPSAINASVQSQYGCAPLRPLKVSDVLIFNQSLGSFLRDFSFDFAIDGYRGNDISIFASHLFEGYQIVDWCYQKVPDSIIWVVRSDGVLLSCTYIREQQVLAWSHHDFNNGFVENVSAIPENGEYAVYASIKRTINGSTVRYIERISSRIWTDPIDASLLDSFIKYDGTNTGNAGLSLRAINGTPIIVFIQVGINDGIQFKEPLLSNNEYSAIISPGNYSVADLATASAAAMNATGQQIYTGSVSGGKIQISTAGSFLLQFGSGDPNFFRSAALTLGFLEVNYSVGTSIIAGNVPVAEFASDGTAYQQLLALTADSGAFTSDIVGKQIFLSSTGYDNSEGYEIRLTVQQYISGLLIYVTPSRIVPSDLQGNPFSKNWALATKTVSGLDHLVGQEVSVWADRFVVGSPLNSHYSTVYTVASDGTLTLDKPYAVIYVGLPMIQDLETLDLETYFGETMLGRRKRATGLAGYLYKTRSFYVGTENPDTNPQNSNSDKLFQLFPLRTGMGQDTYDEPPPLLTDQDYVLTTARWNKNGRLFIRNVDPVPFGLLAISPKEEDAVQGTYKRV